LHGLALAGFGEVTLMKTEKRITEIGGDMHPSNDATQAIELQKPYRVAVEIEGVCPILFHRWSVESVEAKSKAKKGSAVRKTDDVESYVYRNAEGNICIPGEYLRQSIIHSAKYEQDPRSPRKSMMDLAKAAIVSITELADTNHKDWDYLDQRRVSMNKGSSITRSRPALKMGWKAGFILQVNLPEYIPQEMLNYLIQQAGRIIGLSNFRPSFGRFIVTRFEVLDD